jgi:hypothetical protein
MIAPMAADAASAPSLGSTGGGYSGNGATLEAVVVPNGAETTYEFSLEGPACEAHEPACEAMTTKTVGEGVISADSPGTTVTVTLTGLAWSTTYRYWVTVTNSIGSSTSGALTFTTSSAPVGLAPGQQYEPSVEPWFLETAQREADRLATQHDAEDAPVPAAVATSSPPPEVCAVPSLKGRTVKSARAALRRADCTLGRVEDAHGRTRGSVVVAQGHPTATQLPAGTPIGLRLGSRGAAPPA